MLHRLQEIKHRERKKQSDKKLSKGEENHGAGELETNVDLPSIGSRAAKRDSENDSDADECRTSQKTKRKTPTPKQMQQQLHKHCNFRINSNKC